MGKKAYISERNVYYTQKFMSQNWLIRQLNQKTKDLSNIYCIPNAWIHIMHHNNHQQPSSYLSVSLGQGSWQTPNTYSLNPDQTCQTTQLYKYHWLFGKSCYQKIAKKALIMPSCKESSSYIKVGDQWLFHAAYQSQH